MNPPCRRCGHLGLCPRRLHNPAFEFEPPTKESDEQPQERH